MGRGKSRKKYVRLNDPNYYDVVYCPDDPELGAPMFQGSFLVQDFNTTLRAGYFPTGMEVQRNGQTEVQVVYGKGLVSMDKYHKLAKDNGAAWPHLELDGVSNRELRAAAHSLFLRIKRNEHVPGILSETGDMVDEVYGYCSRGTPGGKYYVEPKVESLSERGWAELLAKIGLLFSQELPSCGDPTCEFCNGGK